MKPASPAPALPFCLRSIKVCRILSLIGIRLQRSLKLCEYQWGLPVSRCTVGVRIALKGNRTTSSRPNSQSRDSCSSTGCNHVTAQLLLLLRLLHYYPYYTMSSLPVKLLHNVCFGKRAVEAAQTVRLYQGCEADVITFNATITACARGRQWQASLNRHGNSVHFTGIRGIFFSDGFWKLAGVDQAVVLKHSLYKER